MGFETKIRWGYVEEELYYEAIPMGFETRCRETEYLRRRKHYEAIPMGFETTHKPKNVGVQIYIMKLSLWDLKLNIKNELEEIPKL